MSTERAAHVQKSIPLNLLQQQVENRMCEKNVSKNIFNILSNYTILCEIACQKQEYILHYFMDEKMDHQNASNLGDGVDRQGDYTRQITPATCQETSGQQGKRNTIFFPELGLTLPDMGVEVNVTSAQSAENDNHDQLRACANTLEGNPPESDQGSRGSMTDY